MKQASITTALVAGVAMFVVYAAPAADDLHFVTKTSRPLREICNTLEERCHWRISFEEPPLPPGDQAKASPTGFSIELTKHRMHRPWCSRGQAIDAASCNHEPK